MPHSAAGTRVDPPVSVPRPLVTMRAAIATAVPPDEPAGTRVRRARDGRPACCARRPCDGSVASVSAVEGGPGAPPQPRSAAPVNGPAAAAPPRFGNWRRECRALVVGGPWWGAGGHSVGGPP